MKNPQISLSVETEDQDSLLQELTEQQQEKLCGGNQQFLTSAAWFLSQMTSWSNYNWKYGGGEQKFINNVKQNGLGVIDKRVNAILGIFRYW